MTDAALVGAVEPPDLHVMSYNIRRVMPRRRRSPDAWRRRAPLLARLVREQRPSLLGVQESLAEQTALVSDALGAGYRSVGRGRDADGGGEACVLFVDTDRLELLDWGQHALSDRPDVPGSRGWGAPFPRVLVTAELRDRATGGRMLALNTHFDAFVARARVHAARAVRERVEAVGLPAVVTGDLNAGPRSAAIAELLRDEVLMDAWAAADERLSPEFGTYARYRRPRAPGVRIDWIAVGAGVHVRRAAIDGRAMDGGWASDHLPVHAVVRMPA